MTVNNQQLARKMRGPEALRSCEFATAATRKCDFDINAHCLL